jgi:hypothetical protein
MRYNDIIYDPLFEALTPGEIRDIKIQIKDYEDEIYKLQRKKRELDDEFYFGSFPAEIQNKVNAYIEAYTREIEKLQKELRNAPQDLKFNNLMNGIKKNCSEIVAVYKKERSFLYAQFNGATGQTAFYTVPRRLKLSNYYGNASSIQTLIEKYYPEQSFESSLQVNSSPGTFSNLDTFIVFPRNGFTTFWSRKIDNLDLSEGSIPRLFDRDIIGKAWDTFIGDEEMFWKFKAVGGDTYYKEKQYIGEADGFMGRYNYIQNIKAIEKLIDRGVVGEEWRPYTSWLGWVSESSFKNLFDFTTGYTTALIRESHTAIMYAPGVYAIEKKYRKQVASALGLEGFN